VQLTAKPSARATLVRAGRLLDPRSGNVLSPAAVLLEDGTIKEVGSPARVQADSPPGVNIVDLGLVYECDVSKNEDASRTVDIKMTLTAPGCGMGEVLVQDVRDKIQIVPTVARANVELVFDPPWNQTMMSDEARLQTGMM